MPPGSSTNGRGTGQTSTGKPSSRPPSPGDARGLLEAAEDLAATGGRAPETMTDADLSRLLDGIAPAEAALDRAALMALGAARGRGWAWPRIGKALGMTADGARDRFDRAAARHPDYTAPLPPTLGAHISRAGDLIAAIADPPGPYLAHSAARLLGAVLLTATLEETPELVGHWLTDSELSAATAAAARHPKNDGAYKALVEFAGVRPGTRADLLDILREAVQGSPWVVAPARTGAAPLPSSGAVEVGGAMADLVIAAGLPPALAEPLAELHTGAAPHLARPAEADHTAVLNALAALDRAVTGADPRALAAAVHGLAAEGVDRADFDALAGVGNPLGRVLLTLDGHPSAMEESTPEDGVGFDPGDTAQDWQDRAAAVLPSTPNLAAATGRLLTAAAPRLGAGDLGHASTYDSLHHLRQAVMLSNRATIGAALDRAVALNPAQAPLNRYPQVADALRALIHAYDNQ